MEEKRKNRTPGWIGPLAILCGLVAFVLVQWVVTGRLGSPIGIKGEGLLFALVLYVPLRFLLRFAHRKRVRRRE